MHPALERTVGDWAAAGWSVEFSEERRAVMSRPNPVNHALHVVLTLLTCGAWGLVWLIAALTRGVARETLVVDEHGNVSIQRPAPPGR